MDNYLIIKPEACGLWSLVSCLAMGGHLPYTGHPPDQKSAIDSSWQAKVAMLLMKLLQVFATAFRLIGIVVQSTLNIVGANGGFWSTIFKIIIGSGLIIPKDGSLDDWTMLGWLDQRVDIDWVGDGVAHMGSNNPFLQAPPGSKLIADVCMMASKIAYENDTIIRKVVTENWRFNLVGIYECLNMYEPKNPTQVLIFTDKAQDAAAIFIAFRGTEPFDAYDWSTDIDFSWYELPGVGRVHLGFLESLGLVDRNDMNTFERMKLNVAKGDGFTSGLFEDMLEGPNAPIFAYDEASKVTKELLAQNKNAKLYITGHSLGGALATVFTTMLFYKKEDLVTERVAAVFTFGQPRVGDEDYANYMNGKLNFPNYRYFRVVYCNDVVARVPYDNILFQFRHFGLCFYFDSRYNEKCLAEEPNRNFSLIYFLENHIIAVWELIQSFRMGRKYGAAYKETTFCTIFRILGIILPGLADHNPVNYVNSVRLGPPILIPKITQETG